MDKIYRFKPYLKPVIWGGDKIAALKGLVCESHYIGESWEISGVDGQLSIVDGGHDDGLDIQQLIDKYGAKLIGSKAYNKCSKVFPLLIKFIDARSDLSVQVHPDDALARARHNCYGKTEMWYIISAEPEAMIYSGMAKEITPEEYTRLVQAKTIMDAISAHKSTPGEVFFIPAGRVHSIGGGNLLLEIQQTSDVTYRIYDYDRRDADGNARELHTQMAKDAIDYHVYPSYITDYDHDSTCSTLAACQYFTVKRHKIEGSTSICPTSESFTILTCVEGSCTVTADEAVVELRQFQTILIAACASEISLNGLATVISSSV